MTLADDGLFQCQVTKYCKYLLANADLPLAVTIPLSVSCDKQSVPILLNTDVHASADTEIFFAGTLDLMMLIDNES